MILLRPDCLVFETPAGENLPCSAHAVTVELLGPSANDVDPELIYQAAEAVLHYFRTELGRTHVSVREFGRALEKALTALGLDVVTGMDGPMAKHSTATKPPAPPARVAEADLHGLAREAGAGRELVFFPRLRDELRGHLANAAQVVWFRGLRPCVRQLTGAKRWTNRCESLNDQIIDYLRTCLRAERAANHCALVVM